MRFNRMFSGHPDRIRSVLSVEMLYLIALLVKANSRILAQKSKISRWKITGVKIAIANELTCRDEKKQFLNCTRGDESFYRT
jgi:hypothetical protein